MRRPLGCLTYTALISSVAAVLVTLALVAVTGGAIFSPGALGAVTHGVSYGGVTSHAALGGRCDACHAAIWSDQTMGDLCLACHTEVGREIAANNGLHGPLHASASTCRSCHTEHHGPTAALTTVDPRVFPHSAMGFVLTAHEPPATTVAIGCRDCHPDSPATYTPPACLGCHQQLGAAAMTAHTSTFGLACLNCHNGIDTYGHQFAHATWPLTGGHRGPSCDACHHGSGTLAALRATSQACDACHAKNDIHQGRLGTVCSQCHTTATWANATFDHSVTSFPLQGAHASVACVSCHPNGRFAGTPTACASCHQPPPTHDSHFGSGCAACHTTTAWTPATFDHSRTPYRLTGAHVGLACGRCHTSPTTYAGAPTACVGCHAKPASHPAAYGTVCSICHTTTAWLPIHYTGPHPFPMTHGGAAGRCSTCHPASLASYTCSACHSNSAMVSAHAGIAGFSLTTCVRCHPTGASGG